MTPSSLPAHNMKSVIAPEAGYSLTQSSWLINGRPTSRKASLSGPEKEEGSGRPSEVINQEEEE